MGKEEYFKQRDEIINTYKAEGRKAEIESALKELQASFKSKELDVEADLCWLYGSFLDDYLHDVEICQAFARRSRECMAEIILERTGMTALEAFHTIHNYIDTETEGAMILRKGAVSAKKGEKLLIPINMRDGSLVCIGKGNEDWNCSAPHGAGRVMSRIKAKKILNLEEFKSEMFGIWSSTVNKDTLDEAPMAYKTMDDIVANIGETAEIVKIIKPIYNFKAAE